MRKMPGMSGEEEEHPANKSAVLEEKKVSTCNIMMSSYLSLLQKTHIIE